MQGSATGREHSSFTVTVGEPIIPDLIEIGVDILNPVQPECMDPVKLKDKHGDKLCFDGTIGVQSTLPFGSSEDVTREVKKRVSTLGPTHSMQPDVPIGNVPAMYRATLRYGRNTRIHM